ncbi:hypothetical protein GS942_27300 [Rhodococcus hoagii]|nr:hypothetical protein [Prescottella equi]
MRAFGFRNELVDIVAMMRQEPFRPAAWNPTSCSGVEKVQDGLWVAAHVLACLLDRHHGLPRGHFEPTSRRGRNSLTSR